MTAYLGDVLTEKQQGLALFAEQAGEAAHCKMKPVMKRHSRSEDHKDHGQRQLTAVTKFASRNLKDVAQLTNRS